MSCSLIYLNTEINIGFLGSNTTYGLIDLIVLPDLLNSSILIGFVKLKLFIPIVKRWPYKSGLLFPQPITFILTISTSGRYINNTTVVVK